MLISALAFIWLFGNNIPCLEDWGVVLALSNSPHMPWYVVPIWLWVQNNEHRMPLPWLVHLLLFKFTGLDFRAGMFFNAIALSILALLMIRVARTLRGRTSFADAFFPLVLLNYGYFEYFTLSPTLSSVVTIMLAGVMLTILLRADSPLTPRRALVVGLCLFGLPLCGGMGLLLMPALAVWVGYVALRPYPPAQPQDRRTRRRLLGFLGATVCLTGLYFVGYQRPGNIPPNPGLGATLIACTEFSSMAFAISGIAHWPYLGLIVLSLFLLSVAALVLTWYRRPENRCRTLGLLFFLGALGSLILGLGWGRAGYGAGAGFALRYPVLASPILCGVYLAWVLVKSRPISSLVQFGLLLLACLTLPVNTMVGLSLAASRRQLGMEFERDARSGLPPSTLAERHAYWLFPDEHWLAVGLDLLRQARLEPYRSLPNEPILRDVAMPPVPISLYQVVRKGEAWEALGDDPSMVFALREPQFVSKIRLKCSYENLTQADVQVFWRKADQNDFAEERSSVRHVWGVWGGAERTVTFDVNDTLDQLRIDPSTGPCLFNISAIVLLVPEGEGERAESAWEGHLDEADSFQISGWAWDQTRPDSTVQVSIYDGAHLLATVPADQFRQDLLDAGKGNGKQNFTFSLPAGLLDSKQHTIRVKYGGTNLELPASPKTVTLTPPP